MRNVRGLWKCAWPFVALCVLASSRWLIEGGLPATASTLGSEALGCLGAAGVAGLYALRTPGCPQPEGRRGSMLLPSLAAAIAVTGPAMAEGLAGRAIHSSQATLALALTPVVVAVAAGATGQSEGDSLTGRLWPGLAGLAALLLLLPEPTYSGWRPWVGLAAMPLLTGLGAAVCGPYLVAGERDPRTNLHIVTVGLLVAATVFATLGWPLSHLQGLQGWPWSAAGLDGLSALLTLLVLVRMDAQRWSAQYLTVPLLGLLEGIVFLHPFLDGRTWVGLALLAIGGVRLLYGFRSVEPLTTSLSSEPEIPSA